MRLVRMIWYDLAKACDACYATEQNFGRQAEATCGFARGSIGKASSGARPVGGALCSHEALNTKAVIQQSQCMLDVQCLLPYAAW